MTHCNLPVVAEAFPPSVRSISITYSRVREFAPPALPDRIASVDLSFNSLREIPEAVYQAFARDPSVRINLKNNDLWFAMYTDLPARMVSPAVVGELLKAHRLNLISTQRLTRAIDTLRHQKCDAEARHLSQRITAQVTQRAHDGGYSWQNAENVHFDGVQQAVRASIDKLMNIDTRDVRARLDREGRCVLDAVASDRGLRARVEADVKSDSRYAALARQVFALAVMYDVDPDIIRDELRDGIDTCMSGKIARIVNCLNGFVPGIAVGLSANEEIANSVLVVRNRNALLYGADTDKYAAETIPAVLQILEDACVAPAEQAAWIEYV